MLSGLRERSEPGAPLSAASLRAEDWRANEE
jgi:hypothetical protein